MSLFAELKRRNVLRAGAAYAVAAWLIIQVVETIFPAFGFGDTAVRLVVIVLAIGFIPAMVLAWAFELTPEGLIRDSKVDRAEPGVKRRDKRLDRIIMVVLALALGYFAFDKFVLSPRELAEEVAAAHEMGRSEAQLDSAAEQSIAVLAFSDLSPSGDQEYLSDGIAEEVLNLLSTIPELRVVSRSSAFSYKDKNVDVVTIGEQLDVAHVLEGSVRKSGERVRVTAQLIDARTDSQIWSETYDRRMEGIFSLQDELAAAVVDRLKLSLVEDLPGVRKVDPDAYVFYLQARNLNESGDSREQAIALLKRALSIEPGYLEAWLELFQTYDRMLGRYEPGSREYEAVAILRQEAVRRAREIDPELSESLMD